jgi:predicted transcriptional regulator
MAIRDIDWTEAVPVTNEEDEEILAAIDRGVNDADAGNLVPMEEVRRRFSLWTTRSSSLTSS